VSAIRPKLHAVPSSEGPLFPATTDGSAGRIAEIVLGSLDDDKAEDIVLIDLVGKTSIADAMIIASGRSSRQVAAMADHLSEKLKAAGIKGVEIEGKVSADWVLIDAGDVIVHLFRPEVRAFYNIEKMWGVEGPAVAVGTA